MSLKKESRLKRAKRTRKKIDRLNAYRLSVHKSSQHTYAQVIEPETGNVKAAASTVEKAIKDQCASTANIEAAEIVGKKIAEKADAAGIKKVAFDRSGFKYHGRVKAVADAARQNGMEL